MDINTLKSEFKTGDVVTQKTIDDLIDAEYAYLSQMGQPNGIATLDSTGMIPLSLIPNSAVNPTTLTYTTVPSPCYMSQGDEVVVRHGTIANQNYSIAITEEEPDATGITNTIAVISNGYSIVPTINTELVGSVIRSKLRSDLTWFEDSLMLDFSTGAVIDHSINAINNWTANGDTFTNMFNSITKYNGTTALHLNGTNISTPNNIALNPGTSNFTFSFWIYPSSVNKVIIPMPITGSIFPLLEINASSQVVLHSSTNALTVATPALTQGVWSFVTIGVKTNFVTPASAYGFACVQGNSTPNYSTGADWNGGYNFNTNFQIGSTFQGYLAIFRFITKVYDQWSDPIPLATNLIPTMYSNTTYATGTGSPTLGTLVITASEQSQPGISMDSMANVWMPFSNTGNYAFGFGETGGGSVWFAITIDFGVPTKVDSYACWCVAYIQGSSYPHDLYIQGSFDNANWQTLGTQHLSTASSTWVYSDARIKPLTQAGIYRYYRYYHYASYSNTSSTLQVYNLGLYANYNSIGMPFPAWQLNTPTLIETTDANHFNLGTCSRISSVVFAGNIPSPTCIKTLVSFDGRNTWKYYNQGQWFTSTLANIQTNGISTAAMSTALTSYQVQTADTYLDFAFSLQQEYNSTAAVSLSGVTITYDDTGIFAPATVGSYSSNCQFGLTNVGPISTKIKKLSAGTGQRVYINLTAAIIPATAVYDVNVVNTEAAMLALVVTTGQVAVRTDTQTVWLLSGTDHTQLSNWMQLPNAYTVYSVNGHSGVVNLTAADFNAVPANSLKTGAYRNISVGSVAPSNPQSGDVWIKTH